MAAAVSRSDLRERVTQVAAALLAEQGPGAVTTRGVAEAAGVQAPTIYRLFGDKDGLLEAVAEHAMAAQVQAKAKVAASAASEGVDPLEDLRDGWRSQIEFGLANPALFRLLSDPDRVRTSAAAQAGREVLSTRIHRIAAAGLLRVSEDRATDLVQAAGIGVIQSLLSMTDDRRDVTLAEAMYEAVLTQILCDVPAPDGADATSAAAIALHAAAPELTMLTEAEQRMLSEWLTRIIERKPSATT
jgi:AcrR family transcriptional regulator